MAWIWGPKGLESDDNVLFCCTITQIISFSRTPEKTPKYAYFPWVYMYTEVICSGLGLRYFFFLLSHGTLQAYC